MRASENEPQWFGAMPTNPHSPLCKAGGPQDCGICLVGIFRRFSAVFEDVYESYQEEKSVYTAVGCFSVR